MTKKINKLSEYGYSFQTKVISHLLNDKKFLTNVYDLIEVENFESTQSKWIIETLLDYYKKYNTYPTMDVLAINVKKIDNDILKLAVTEYLREIYFVDKSDIEFIEEEFKQFCKNQKLKQALLQSVTLLEEGEYEDIRKLIDNAVKSGDEKDVGHEYKKDTESRYRDDDRKVIPFPWNKWNKMTQGGYGKGDLIIIFGNPGGGKSWVVSSMGATAALEGKTVVHYTLELSEGYVGKRYDTIFTSIPIEELVEKRQEVEKIIEAVPGKIIIKEYSPKRASIRTIESHFRKLKSTGVIGPEEDCVIIIDYLDLLKNKNKRNTKEEDLDDVYTEAKGLAKELGIPIISPSQANRTAAKSSIIEGDAAAGSYSKIMIGDMVFSLARTKTDKIRGTGRFHWIKNRYGPDGHSFNAAINTAAGKIEILNEYNDEEDFNSINEDERNFLRKKFNELEELQKV